MHKFYEFEEIHNNQIQLVLHVLRLNKMSLIFLLFLNENLRFSSDCFIRISDGRTFSLIVFTET